MAEEQPSLHVDTDWKRQAQEEKRRLAEQEKARTAAAAPAAGAATAAAEAGAPPTADRATRGMPQASFGTLVQSIVTQVLFYLGDLAPQGSSPAINLDMAKHQIDTLTILEQKTANNLTDDEKRLLDAALYETRMRYVQVASQYIT